MRAFVVAAAAAQLALAGATLLAPAPHLLSPHRRAAQRPLRLLLPNSSGEACAVPTGLAESCTVSLAPAGLVAGADADPLRPGRTWMPKRQQPLRPQYATAGIDQGVRKYVVYAPVNASTAPAAPVAEPLGDAVVWSTPDVHSFDARGRSNDAPTRSSAGSYTTASIVYATPTPSGSRYITQMEVNGVKVAGTFDGQSSPYLPAKPWQPRSPATAANSYADLLGLSLLFYEEQRLGLLSSPRRASWRNSSALHDGLDNGLDLTGGYADAGDYLKFTHPMSSSVALLIWGCTENWRGVYQAGHLGYLDQFARWSYDWLIKAHPAGSTLYMCVSARLGLSDPRGQVGDADLDNNSWRRDQDIVEPRPSYAVDSEHPGTDVAAGTAAAFAAGAVLYATVLDDRPYALKLLQHATALYYFAEATPKTLYQVSVPAVKKSYASSSWEDELVWGALHLWRATQDDYFVRRAAFYAKKYDLGSVQEPTSWDSKHGVSLLLGAQLAYRYGANSTSWRNFDWRGKLDAYVDAMLKTSKTPGGLLWFGDDTSGDASLVVAVNTAYLLSEYARTFANASDAVPSRIAACQKMARSQLDYVLGSNPPGYVYMVGASSHSPKNPQSAFAAGGGDIGTIDTDPKEMAYVLYGAIVGGPDKNDGFKDIRSDWQHNEVALDYNALLTPLLASRVAGGEVPYFLRSQTPTDSRA